jgi:hypothetical protein
MKLVFLLLLTPSLFCNPFKIDWEEKEDLSPSDYVKVEQDLQKLSIAPTLDLLYPEKTPSSWFYKKKVIQKKQDFEGRMSRGIRQIMIDTSKGLIPKKELIPINGGGNFCIVSFCSYNDIYHKLQQEIPKALEKVGFHGHVLLMTGGFPNPTGKEMQYAGVPYSFKIFSLLEAEKLGFQKVLWIDAALLPLANPEPLFHWIEEKGSFFHSRKNSSRYILPETQKILLEKTGSDMYITPCVRARIIGLDLSLPKAKALIKDYYELVELGTPFMSCFPEEFVLGALIHKNPEEWPFHPFEKLVKSERKMHGKTQEQVEKMGFFFLLRHH